MSSPRRLERQTFSLPAPRPASNIAGAGKGSIVTDSQTSDSRCHIYTFKDGLLSRLAHDLLLAVGRLEVQIVGEPRRIEATFDAASIAVVCAMKDGRRAEGLLSARERGEIQRNLATEVLQVARHPQIRFVSEPLGDGEPKRLRGRLTIRGQSRDVAADVHRNGDWLSARFELDQRDFGIRPYSAMLGALRIKARLVVEAQLHIGDG